LPTAKQLDRFESCETRRDGLYFESIFRISPRSVTAMPCTPTGERILVKLVRDIDLGIATRASDRFAMISTS